MHIHCRSQSPLSWVMTESSGLWNQRLSKASFFVLRLRNSIRLDSSCRVDLGASNTLSPARGYRARVIVGFQ